MILKENVPLSSLTTLRVGGSARYVAMCESAQDVRDAFSLARERGLPVVPLGEGSNVLASDRGFAGVILHLEPNDISFSDTGDFVEAVTGAGFHFDALVSEAASRGLWGLENLAGIPGTVGAAPVQNIGAYGSELADTFLYATVYDSKTDSIEKFSKEDCRFGYRDSRFKQEQGLVILEVAFALCKEGAPHVSYKDLQAKKADGASLDTPAQIASIVRDVRAWKFPDIEKEGTAGSFFKNPVVPADIYERVRSSYADFPGYPTSEGVKIPIAFVLDHVLNLRGFRMGRVRLYERHALVLVADAGATEEEVNALADEVSERVRRTTGIEIEREVRSLA